jgi:hypothetical protein
MLHYGEKYMIQIHISVSVIISRHWGFPPWQAWGFSVFIIIERKVQEEENRRSISWARFYESVVFNDSLAYLQIVDRQQLFQL